MDCVIEKTRKSGLAARIGQFAMAALLAGTCTTAAFAQADSVDDTIQIPENISILGPRDPNSRHATAVVNGAIITGTDVDQRVALVLDANETGAVSDEEMKRLRLQVLRNLIDETLQIQEADAQKMTVTPDEVESTYNRVSTQRFNRPPEEMDTYLRSIGSSPQSLKRQIEGEMAWDRLLRRNVQPFVNVSSDEVTEMMDRLKASAGTNEYRIGEIYLASTPATQEAVAANARQIVDQIKQGGSFVAYARQYSQSSTASSGGDLGWIRLEQLQNPQLENIVQTMAPGQLAGPVEIPGGFDILYLIDKRQIGAADPRDAVVSLKQISINFPKGTSQEQASEKASAFSQAVAQIQSCDQADAKAKAIGAEVVGNDSLTIRSLPEALQTMLLNLQVGQSTPPFGSLQDGVRVLMLCGRQDPVANEGPDFEQLRSQLEDDRVNKRAQRYLRDLRRDAVIDFN
ncbi:peptidylprolyl isomerase [Altererythrobacter sp. B11]|uniref:peptidylprolyl isomerase n=1 Tax=Altererythrobacter sp. B11 TaxID=2060312 RepID=UPI003FA42593